MSLDAKEIVEFVRTQSAHPMRPKELAKALNVSVADYRKFRNILRKLIDSGELVKLKRGRIGVAEQLNVVVGKLMIVRSGTGFVTDERGGEDIMIAPTDLLTGLDGDKVMVRLTGKRDGRKSGSVIKVIERAARNIVGVFHIGKTFSYVVPDNKRIHRDLYIAPAGTGQAEDGEKVVAVLTEWEHPYLNPEGKVIERLGFPGEPGVDMLSVMKGFNLSREFPHEVMEEAEKAAAADIAKEAGNRTDFTGECLYTIDPFDAKDFDDAVSVEKTAGGYRLSVHIADVSFFVQEGSKLDGDALQRGTSVYLPGTVVPMLPEVLSNDVCSLKPNRRRLAQSAVIDFDQTGKMLKWETHDSVIKSQARLTYEEVQDFFDGKLGEPGKSASRARIKRVAENLTHARELAQLLTKRRLAAGSLDLEVPESKVTLDKEGKVVEIKEYERLESHRLVEEFMLAANKAVALEIFRANRPSLYRVHDRPDMEKAQAFSEMMGRLGYHFPVSPTMKPTQYARFLDKVKGAPEAFFINELMLRSMQKAAYQPENIGHFGLAFKHYTHFTSPIRRYPDLLVHRLLRMLRQGKYTSSRAKEMASRLVNVGRHCSEMERQAETAEREAVKIKQVEYMAGQVGEEFSGIISGVMPFGFFVRIDGIGAEGLVRMSSIDDDYYHHEEEQYRIVGRWSQRAFRLGDRVNVGVLKVDTERHEIDLFLPKMEEKPVRTARPGKKGKAAPKKIKHGRKSKKKVSSARKPRSSGRRGRSKSGRKK